MVTQVDEERAAVQMGRADKMGLPFRKLALGFQGMPQKQRFAYDKPEDRVAQKLQLLVIGAFGDGGGTIGKPGPVRQCALQQSSVTKAVPDLAFQLLERGSSGYRHSARGLSALGPITSRAGRELLPWEPPSASLPHPFA